MNPAYEPADRRYDRIQHFKAAVLKVIQVCIDALVAAVEFASRMRPLDLRFVKRQAAKSIKTCVDAISALLTKFFDDELSRPVK